MRRAGPIARAQATQGLRLARNAPGCGQCAHAEPRQPAGAYNDLWRLHCSVGGFGVGAATTCNRFTVKEKPCSSKP
ncbi:hypothetical protein H0I39_01960 [Ottowia beijingensis]|jgi:hypothetical protein|uniref:Uncharacterized protein n=1 Tax=Ottowia beijingensis TaxID=1207057 RepID=A0A853IT45_9BURK|nr:hypothetical protein [Ottowia beijingensis]NZA00854.1 hypothetical protein [Ottowia beijingensis]